MPPFKNSAAPLRTALYAAATASAFAGLLRPPASTAEDVETSAKQTWPALSEPVSSFGGAVVDGRLYIYSGHIGDAHAHSKKNLSPSFQRLTLDAPQPWEQLPAGPGLQGLPLAAHAGNLYRIGGLSARNEPGAEPDLISVADFSKFDPRTKSWTALRPLPEGRSSHDAVVADGKLYVVGGWNLGGGAEKWHTTSLVFDLEHPTNDWQTLPPQPFQRRALATVVHDGKLFALGGMTPKGPSPDVHCFDLATRTWSPGPSVPEGETKGKMNGFGCSACTVGGRLFLSTMDGAVHELSGDGRSWRPIGRLQTARFFHRLLPRNERELIAVAGASMKLGHLASLESFAVPQPRP